MDSLSQIPEPFFISIIPNFPGQEEYTAELIRERYKKTGKTGVKKFFVTFL